MEVYAVLRYGYEDSLEGCAQKNTLLLESSYKLNGVATRNKVICLHPEPRHQQILVLNVLENVYFLRKECIDAQLSCK